MGRRSINTTKSGKYMNPTDQARKEARKKELKKNKKQRQLVRAAVLKNKDPSQILEEMEKIDEMEYNVLQPSPLNEKVLRDKRKKLKETFDRVMRLYHNEEPEQWTELKRKEVEYEKKRLKKQQYFDSVKYAQSVQIDEIPLPSMTQNSIDFATNLAGSKAPAVTSRMPPMTPALGLHSLQSSSYSSLNIDKPNDEKLHEKGECEKGLDVQKKYVLSIPAGPPPNLFEMYDLDSDYDESKIVLKKYVPKNTNSDNSSSDNNKSNPLQRSSLAISGQNIDEFMKEMENVHKSLERENAISSTSKKTHSEVEQFKIDTPQSDKQRELANTGVPSDEDSLRMETKSKPTSLAPMAVTLNATISQTSLPPPPSTSLQHMGKAPTDNMQLPGPGRAIPGASGSASTMLPLNMAPPMVFRPPLPRPPISQNFGLGAPPLGPPGPPPNMRRPMMGGPTAGRLTTGIRIPGPPPGLPMRMAPTPKNPPSAAITTITAKPKIRNLSADVTRFVPSALRIKREDNPNCKPSRSRPYISDQRSTNPMQNMQTKKLVTKDDAYMQFMNEMQDLL